MFRAIRAHRHQRARRDALPARALGAPDAQPGDALVLELPLLQRKAVNLAEILIIARGQTPKGGDLLALLRGHLFDFTRLLERLAANVIMHRHKTHRDQRIARYRLARLGAINPAVAPVLIQVDQLLLATGHHTIFTQAQADRRLSLAQHDDAVLDRQRQFADVDKACTAGEWCFAQG